MHIFLIRHAHAEDGSDDEVRPLSERGKKQVRNLGHFLRENGALDAEEIWHSPLVRSRETAQRLAKRLRHAAAVIEHSGLRPDDDPGALAAQLAHLRHPVAIVGHDPHLSMLATVLVSGRAEPLRFKLKKASLLRLDRTPEGWTVNWLVHPDLI